MSTLVAHIPVDLDELLENRTIATCALGSEARRVVEVAVDLALVLIVRVVRSEHGRAYGAREVLDVILLVCRAGVVNNAAAPRGVDALQAVM